MLLVKIFIFLVVFGAVFFQIKFFYPLLERQVLRWQKKKIDKITPKIDRMFIDLPLKRLMLLDILTPFISGILAFVITKNLWITLGAAGIGLSIPLFIVKLLEKQRRRKFASQMVDTLMILSSCLKAGLSLTQSFEVLTEEIAPPMSQEFGLLLRQMQMGVSLEDAMFNLKKRMDVEELDMMVTAMMVAREIGGDLTETFSKIAYTIQERNKLIGRVNALCVQGKLQGAIMCILPIAFALFVYNINPHFFDVMLNDNFGRFLLGYALASQVLGIFFILKLSKVDI